MIADNTTRGFLSIADNTWQFLKWLRRYVEATLAKTNSPIFSVGALRLLLDYALQNGLPTDLKTLTKLYYNLLLPLAREGYIQIVTLGNKPFDTIVNIDTRVINND